MKKECRLFFVFLFFLSFGSAEAIETLILTPKKVKSLLLEQGIAVQMLYLSIAAKRFDLPIAKSRYDTLLTVGGDHTVDKLARTSTFFGTRTDTTHWNAKLDKLLPTGTTLGVHWLNERKKVFNPSAASGTSRVPTYEPALEFTFKQALGENFLGGLDRAEVRQTKLEIGALEESTRHEMNKLIVEAETLFWNWALAREAVQVGKESKLAAQEFLRMTLEKEGLGTAEKTDRLGAEVLVAKRKALLAELETKAAEWEAMLKTALSLESETALAVENVGVDIPAVTMEGAIQHALEQRFDLLAKKKELEGNKVKLVIAKKKKLPTIDLGSTLKLNEVNPGSYETALSDIDSPLWKVEMNIVFPLENREARGLKNQAEQEKIKKLLEVKQLEKSIIHDVVQKFRRLELSRESLAARREAIRLEGEKLTDATGQYLKGRFSAESILRFQDDYLGARQEGLTAKLNLALSALALKEAINQDL